MALPRLNTSAMHDVLKRILARKQEEVAERRARVPQRELEARAGQDLETTDWYFSMKPAN